MSVEGVAAATTLAHAYADVVASLSADEWLGASGCPGWSVQDLVAHTGSNFQVLAVAPDPDAPAPDVSTAEELQDLLVQARRGWTAAQVAEEFAQFLDPACGALAAVQDPSVAEAPMTLTDLGTYPTHALADAFAFDLWCHLTEDLLAPGGSISRPALQPTDELLAPGIGWMLTGLPQMCPDLAAVLDRPLGLTLTGPGGGSWTILPNDGRVSVAEGLLDPAAVATSTATSFVRWGTTRDDWREHVTLAGDESYATRTLDRFDVV